MIGKVLTIGANAFRETLRQPVFCVVLGVAGLMIALSPTFAMFTLLENVRLVKDIGLSTILLAGLTLAVVSASNTLSEELRGRTALMVVARPVGRGQFVAGKFLGIAGAQFVAAYLLTIVLLLTVRIGVKEAVYTRLDTAVLWAEVAATAATLLVAAGANYFFDRPFPSALIAAALLFFSLVFFGFAFFDKDLHVVAFSSLDLQTLRACLVLFWAIVVLSAVAIACATRLSLVASVVVCALVFMVGVLSDYLFGRLVDQTLLAALPYSLIPNLQVFWMGDALSVDQPIPWAYVLSAGGYAALHVAGALLLGMFLFETREIQ